MERERLRQYILSKPGAIETFPFDMTTFVAKVGGKMFALYDIAAEPVQVNLKCIPEQAELLRELHPAVTPGYHMNKRHWNTVTIDGSLADEDLIDMIDESYRLVVQGLPKRLRDALRSVEP